MEMVSIQPDRKDESLKNIATASWWSGKAEASRMNRKPEDLPG
jgi:hypothetical protein